MPRPGRIIILNGASSVGKSSIAKALQAIADETWLHVAMDAFLDMMPERSYVDGEGFTFETGEIDGKPIVTVQAGPAGVRLMAGMYAAISGLARAGNNLIVDDVMLEDEVAEYARALEGLDWRLVGVHSPLEVIEARERARGDRMIGCARAQIDVVHRGRKYDFEVDSSSASPADCAEQIKMQFRL